MTTVSNFLNLFLSSLYLLFSMCDGLGGGLRSLSALLVHYVLSRGTLEGEAVVIVCSFKLGKEIYQLFALTRLASQMAPTILPWEHEVSDHEPGGKKLVDGKTADAQFWSPSSGWLGAQLENVKLVLSDIHRQSELLPVKSIKPIHANWNPLTIGFSIAAI